MKRAGTSLLIAACVCGAGGLAIAQQMPADEAASSGSSAQDTKLEKKIDYRLQHDQKLKARDVDASVKDGVVTLTGTVRTSSEKARADRLAHTKGVINVENQITLEGQEAPRSAGTAAPPGTAEPGTAAPSEGQQAQPPSEGQVRERTTHVEERTETRTERTPQPSQDQPQETAPSSAPAQQNVPPPASPKPPQAPAPSPRSTPPQE